MAIPGNLNNKNTYWIELDGLRTLAFFLVFIGHVGAFPVDFFANSIGQSFATSYNVLRSWGWMGVEIFFVLSAFLITSLLLKERNKFGNISYKLFFIRRMLRIWPLYYSILLIGFFVLPLFSWEGITLGSYSWHRMLSTHFFSFFAFYSNFQFAKLVILVGSVFWPLWSICVEEQFYVVWGSILKFIGHTRNLVVLLISLFVMTVALRWSIQAHSLTYKSYYYNTFSHLDPLLCGALAAILWSKHENSIKKFGAVLFILGLMAISGVIIFMPTLFQNEPSIVWVMTILALGSTFFMLGILSVKSIGKCFRLPPFVAIGRITYGMYIFHFPTLLLCWTIFHDKFHFYNPIAEWNVKFFCGLFATFVLALVSWNCLEKPFNKLRHNFARDSITPAKAGAHASVGYATD